MLNRGATSTPPDPTNPKQPSPLATQNLSESSQNILTTLFLPVNVTTYTPPQILIKTLTKGKFPILEVISTS